ncbi:MAG: hypothetical protein GWP48_14565 [Actinobacteria bacterium]|nr:hypothetical protein [Actinomycetota bacterium]
MRAPLRRCRGDSGQVGGIEVLPFGFLIFVAGTLLLANVWGVIDAKLATTSAAREGARAFVEGDDVYAAAAEAEFRAQESLAAYGRNDERATISAPTLPHGFTRCGRVTITVTYDVPALFVPFIGGFGDLAPVRSTYTELIDPFRDGLPGPALC